MELADKEDSRDFSGSIRSQTIQNVLCEEATRGSDLAHGISTAGRIPNKKRVEKTFPPLCSLLPFPAHQASPCTGPSQLWQLSELHGTQICLEA